MRRVSLSLPTAVLCYLQDVTGEVEPATCVVLYLAGRRRKKDLAETYSGEEFHSIRFRPKTRAEASLFRDVNSKALVETIVSHALRQGVTIRLPSRGIW